MFFFGLTDLGTFPEDFGSLFRPSNHVALRMSVAKTGVSLTKSMGDAMMAGSTPQELGIVQAMG